MAIEIRSRDETVLFVGDVITQQVQVHPILTWGVNVTDATVAPLQGLYSCDRTPLPLTSRGSWPNDLRS